MFEIRGLLLNTGFLLRKLIRLLREPKEYTIHFKRVTRSSESSIRLVIVCKKLIIASSIITVTFTLPLFAFRIAVAFLADAKRLTAVAKALPLPTSLRAFRLSIAKETRVTIVIYPR